MGRAILAVIAGYVLIFIIVFVGASVAFVALGVDRAYQPGTYEVSTLWNIVMLVIGLAAALAGGCVCRAIARRPKPVLALAVVVLVLGGVQAVMTMMAPEPPPGAMARPADVTLMEAVANSRQPMWTLFVTPLVGAVGVLVGGGRLVKAGASNEP